MKYESVRYDELKVGMVVIFHGANVRIKDVSISKKAPANEFYPNDDVIRFKIEPADDKALEILGGFYAYGNYGGIGSLELALVSR